MSVAVLEVGARRISDNRPSRRRAVIADQVKCIDWRGGHAQRKGRLPAHVLERVTAIFCRLILPSED